MEKVFDIGVVNKLGDEKQYDQLIAYIDPFIKAEHPDALAIIGICYDFGYGVKPCYEKAMEFFGKSANLGSAIGQFHYGWYLLCKESLKNEGLLWLKKAAVQGCVPAQCYVACINKNGGEYAELKAHCFLDVPINEGVFKNENSENKITKNDIMTIAIDQGILEAKNLLDKYSISKTSNNIIITAAEQGCVEAQFYIATLLYSVEDRMSEALSWYKKVANNRYVHTNLTLIHNKGFWDAKEFLDFRKKRILPQTNSFYNEKFQWLNLDRKIYQIGDEIVNINPAIEHSMLVLGGHYYNIEENYEESIYWLSKIIDAEIHNIYAYYYLGVMCFNGWGISTDYSKAVHCFSEIISRFSVEKNEKIYLGALLYLGLSYYNGYGTKKDLAKAVECFEKASQNKSKEGGLSKYYLGLCYYNGQGVSVNKEKAITLFNEAASLSHRDGENQENIAFAQKVNPGLDDEFYNSHDSQKLCGLACFFLGYLYETGKGVSKDILKACEFYKRGLDSSYAPVEMLSVRDMLMDPDMDEITLMQKQMELLQEIRKVAIEQEQELHKNKKAFDSIIKDQTTISNTLDKFTKELQAFVAEQKAKASETQNPDDVDIGTISNSISEKIESMKQGDVHAAFQEAREVLEAHFGEYWSELDPATRKALITSEGLFAIMKSRNTEELDYSGICVTACSALENELKIRFVNGYRLFLEKNHGKCQDEMFPNT